MNSSGGGYGTYVNSTSNVVNSFSPQTTLWEPLRGREICVDEIRVKRDPHEDHAHFIRELTALGRQIGDIGGEFWVKREQLVRQTAGSQTCRRNRWFARGVVLICTSEPAQAFSDSWFYSDPRSELDPFGPQGWARFNPGASDAGLGQALVELRELPRMGIATFKELPRILQSRNDFFRQLGSQYLNLEFGWKPFLRDVKDMINLGHIISKKLQQLSRDNGRGVRRRGTLLKARSRTNTSTNVIAISPTGVTQLQNNLGATRSTEYRKIDDIWFSARFRYFIPNTEDPFWRLKAATAAIGVNPNPHLLWQVLPWSWLIDWFTNVGDVLANLSYNSAEDMVADYAYCMRHTKETWRMTAIRNYGTGSTQESFPVPDQFTTRQAENRFERELKCRVRASPFGFGLTENSLSVRQWAILEALGLSFLPRL
jgi:hypothetical protein